MGYEEYFTRPHEKSPALPYRRRARRSSSRCRLLGLLLLLERPHLGVSAILLEQLPVGAALDDTTLIQNENLVGIHHRGKAVSDHQGSAPLSDAIELGLDALLGFGIQG